MSTRPAHHHPGSKFDPATPETKSTFVGATEPGFDGIEAMDKQAGQPDNWPQRPDVVVPKSKEDGIVPTILS